MVNAEGCYVPGATAHGVSALWPLPHLSAAAASHTGSPVAVSCGNGRVNVWFFISFQNKEVVPLKMTSNFESVVMQEFQHTDCVSNRLASFPG